MDDDVMTAAWLMTVVGETTTIGAGAAPVVAKAVAEGSPQLPTEYAIYQNYPNPFNPTTTIKYDLPADAYVTLKIFDILGREMMTLVDGGMVAGYHEVSMDATELSTGVYFYRLVVSKSNPLVVSGANPIQAGTFTDVKKLLLLK